MKRKLEWLGEGGATLMDLYRIEDTDRLVTAITDFGHDYRVSFYEVRPSQRVMVRAHFHEPDFAERLCRDRTVFGTLIEPPVLGYDSITQTHFIED